MDLTTVIGLTFGAYLILLLSIGWWGDRRYGRSYEDFVTGLWATVPGLTRAGR